MTKREVRESERQEQGGRSRSCRANRLQTVLGSAHTDAIRRPIWSHRAANFLQQISVAQGEHDVKPVGNQYRDLLKQLQAVPTAKKALNSAEPLAHTKGGIDIEGLAIAPNGKGLLIGMRSPLLTTKGAFVFTLKNPDQVIKGEKAEIGDTWVLDLGKAGIRAMEFLSASRQYLILAGPPGEGGPLRCTPGLPTPNHNV